VRVQRSANLVDWEDGRTVTLDGTGCRLRPSSLCGDEDCETGCDESPDKVWGSRNMSERPFHAGRISGSGGTSSASPSFPEPSKVGLV
jgi:hypothetical protein